MFTMELWNKKNLEAPLVNSFKTTPQEIDVEPLIKIFREASTFFSNQSFLEKETALLSRCIYRTKTKFRSEKGNKEMQKMNRALLQYLNMNFAYHVQNFNEMLPEANEQAFYLPTKNMLDYILVRLQGVIKLMNRVIECAKSTALYMEQKLPLAQFWKTDFVCIAIVSRVRALAIEIVRFSWRFFNTGVSYSNLLKNTGAQWLNSDYVFSLNLKDYVSDTCLDDINLEENSQIQPSPEKKIMNVEDTSLVTERTFSEMFSSSSKNEDKSPTSTNLNKKSGTNDEKEDELNINTAEDLERFLNSENSKRASSQKLCYFNNLDTLQWNILRKQLKKLLVRAANRKKQAEVKRIMQKIRTVIKKARCS